MNILQLSGLNQAQVIPFVARQMPMGLGKGFVVGTATKQLAPPPQVCCNVKSECIDSLTQAFEKVRLSDGRIAHVPKGFYSATDRQEEVSVSSAYHQRVEKSAERCAFESSQSTRPTVVARKGPGWKTAKQREKCSNGRRLLAYAFWYRSH